MTCDLKFARKPVVRPFPPSALVVASVLLFRRSVTFPGNFIKINGSGFALPSFPTRGVMDYDDADGD